ncbi:MAG TPA: universal stress protein [Pricia sp.]|nr:universal stress protein [Pricia sp.]
MKPKPILLPTDFSSNARNAIDYAIYLFEKTECTFHILHTFEVDVSGFGRTMGKARDTRVYRAMKETSEKGVKRIVDELTSKNQNLRHYVQGS